MNAQSVILIDLIAAAVEVRMSDFETQCPRFYLSSVVSSENTPIKSGSKIGWSGDSHATSNMAISEEKRKQIKTESLSLHKLVYFLSR